MKLLQRLFASNEAWARRKTDEDPEFFSRLEHQQAPEFFWVGCSDSRVPSTQITGLMPGEIFVHRNVANLVANNDANTQSALQFATHYLGVKHFIICGHYGCGGVRAAMDPVRLPDPLGQWLAPLHELYERHRTELEAIGSEQARWDRFCEMNVVEQVRLSCELPIVREAWRRGKPLAIHGWIYSVADGRLRDLNVTVSPELGTEMLRTQAASTI